MLPNNRFVSTVAFWAFLLGTAQNLVASSSLQEVFSFSSDSRFTSCPLTISSGGGSTVQCAKLTRCAGATCGTCVVTPGGSMNTGTFTLPSNGSTINYNLEALNAGYAGYAISTAACLGNSAFLLSLYSDSGCTTPICTTQCGTGATASDTSTLTGCPTAGLTCS